MNLCKPCSTARAVERYHGTPAKYCARCAPLQSDEAMLALLRRDWAVRVLDAWAQQQLIGSPVGHHTTDVAKADDGSVGCALHTASCVGGTHYAPDAARLAAAEAVFDELPESVRAELGSKP